MQVLSFLFSIISFDEDNFSCVLRSFIFSVLLLLFEGTNPAVFRAYLGPAFLPIADEVHENISGVIDQISIGCFRGKCPTC